MKKLLILTTDPTLTKWKTLPKKKAAILKALRSGKNANFADIDIKYVDVVPEVRNERISHAWLRELKGPYFNQGYDLIGLHSTIAQWKKWGIQGTLRGANPIRRDDEMEDFYFSATERSKRNGLDRFIQVALHEIAHGYYQHTHLVDLTHAWHGTNSDITGLFATMDWGLYQPGRFALKEELGQTRFNVLTFVGQLLKNMSYRLQAKPTLFAAAREYLGRDASPRNFVPSEVACAESVSTVIADVIPGFPPITGTWTLWDKLESDDRFQRVTIPVPGTIIISPTGTVKDAPIVGHVGIFGRDNNIMSNNSYNGLWEENYTLDSWNARYKAAGYQTYMYQLKI